MEESNFAGSFLIKNRTIEGYLNHLRINVGKDGLISCVQRVLKDEAEGLKEGYEPICYKFGKVLGERSLFLLRYHTLSVIFKKVHQIVIDKKLDSNLFI